MADAQVTAFAIQPIGTVVVRVNETNVTLGFLEAGQPIAVKRDAQGNIGPAVEAQFYITLKHGRPTRDVQSREDLVKELETELSTAGTVVWRRLGEPT